MLLQSNEVGACVEDLTFLFCCRLYFTLLAARLQLVHLLNSDEVFNSNRLLRKKMAYQRLFELHAVFTMILCGTNFCIRYDIKLTF